MTLERAIEILNPEHREQYDSLETVEEACRMGMRALEKQIPKELDYEGDGYDENGDLIYDYAKCRVCGHDFEYGINDWGCKYCSDCGQALDWGQTDESKK